MQARVIDSFSWTGKVANAPGGFDSPGIVLVLDPAIANEDPQLSGKPVRICPPGLPAFEVVVKASGMPSTVGLLLTDVPIERIPRGSLVEW
jgi:hypothetical protein